MDGGRANHGARTRSKHDAPNCIVGGQTPSTDEAILADLERAVAAAHQWRRATG